MSKLDKRQFENYSLAEYGENADGTPRFTALKHGDKTIANFGNTPHKICLYILHAIRDIERVKHENMLLWKEIELIKFNMKSKEYLQDAINRIG